MYQRGNEIPPFSIKFQCNIAGTQHWGSGGPRRWEPGPGGSRRHTKCEREPCRRRRHFASQRTPTAFWSSPFALTKDRGTAGSFAMAVRVRRLVRAGRPPGALLRVTEGTRARAEAGDRQVGHSRSSSMSSCYSRPAPHKGSFVRTAKAQSRKGGRPSPPSCFWRYNLPRLLRDLFSVELH